MHRSIVTSSRWLLLFTLIASVYVAAAQGDPVIPSTGPTQSVSDLPSARPATLPYQPRTPIGTSAVQWDGTAMTIHASGEDLPGIIAEVSRATGMKVTGGVPDERVFGIYGPGPVQGVLADLFSGLYVNLLLVNGTATQPKELILTTRTGGPTPPSPPRTIDASDQRPLREGRPFRAGPPAGVSMPPQQPGSPLQGAALAPDANASSTPDANGQPQSPNGVRTPEQIFEELRKRQAAAQPGGAATQ